MTVGRKGGGTNPSITIPGKECSQFSCSSAQRPWKGLFVAKNVPYQEWEFQDLRANTKPRQRVAGAMTEVWWGGGEASPSKQILGSKSS